MHRRHVLAAVGTALTATLAGCEGGPTDDTPTPEPTPTESPDPEELYDPGDAEQLVPDEPHYTWNEDLEGHHDVNENWLRTWMTPDEDVVVLMDAWITADVGDAIDDVDYYRETARDPVAVDVADGAILWEGDGSAAFVFRHSNALGMTESWYWSGVERVADRFRARDYGEWLWWYWQQQNVSG